MGQATVHEICMTDRHQYIPAVNYYSHVNERNYQLQESGISITKERMYHYTRKIHGNLSTTGSVDKKEG